MQAITPNQPKCRTDICRGFAGFSCCDGYDCVGGLNYPDATGSCILRQQSLCSYTNGVCGVKNAIQCCAGSSCNAPFTGALGVCIDSNTYSSCSFTSCAGYAGIECCSGYDCIVDTQGGTIFDALGICLIENATVW
jgi:hypothetical protein